MYFSVKAFLASVYLLAVSHESQATPQQLQCWLCSSETVGAADFCGTTFDESSIPTDNMKQHNITVLQDCINPKMSEHERPVCRKIIDEKNGKTITRRYCYYTNKSDPLDLCSTQQTDKDVRRIFCEDCLTDKCNAASIQKNSAILIILLPVLIAKMFYL